MKPKASLILLLLSAFIISSTACADDRIQKESFHAKDSRFFFDRGQREVSIPLNATVGGWNVNCNRTRAIVWGQAKDLAEVGSPPVTRVYVIDLERDKIIDRYTVTRGPYEVIFSQDQKQASVDDYVVDQASGEIVGMTDDIELIPESCPSFPGKESN